VYGSRDLAVHERPEIPRLRQLEGLPYLRLRARPGIAGIEGRVGEDVVEILRDDIRFVEHAIAVNEGRDDAVRVERQVFGTLLLHPRQVHEPRGPREALLE